MSYRWQARGFLFYSSYENVILDAARAGQAHERRPWADVLADVFDGDPLAEAFLSYTVGEHIHARLVLSRLVTLEGGTLPLDPKPWSVGDPRDGRALRASVEETGPVEWCDFDPRPGYSQNPEDYQ